MRISGHGTQPQPEAMSGSDNEIARLEKQKANYQKQLEKTKDAEKKQEILKQIQQIDMQIATLRANKAAMQKTGPTAQAERASQTGATENVEKTDKITERDTIEPGAEEEKAGTYAVVTDEDGEKQIDYRPPHGKKKNDLWLNASAEPEPDDPENRQKTKNS